MAETPWGYVWNGCCGGKHLFSIVGNWTQSFPVAGPFWSSSNKGKSPGSSCEIPCQAGGTNWERPSVLPNGLLLRTYKPHGFIRKDYLLPDYARSQAVFSRKACRVTKEELHWSLKCLMQLPHHLKGFLRLTLAWNCWPQSMCPWVLGLGHPNAEVAAGKVPAWTHFLMFLLEHNKEKESHLFNLGQ